MSSRSQNGQVHKKDWKSIRLHCYTARLETTILLNYRNQTGIELKTTTTGLNRRAVACGDLNVCVRFGCNFLCGKRKHITLTGLSHWLRVLSHMVQIKIQLTWKLPSACDSLSSEERNNMKLSSVCVTSLSIWTLFRAQFRTHRHIISFNYNHSSGIWSQWQFITAYYI